jgi:hypothetical protein
MQILNSPKPVFFEGLLDDYPDHQIDLEPLIDDTINNSSTDNFSNVLVRMWSFMYPVTLDSENNSYTICIILFYIMQAKMMESCGPKRPPNTVLPGEDWSGYIKRYDNK